MDKGVIKIVTKMIRDGILRAYPDAVIYEEQANQIERPAFYITEIKVSQDKAVGNRYYRYFSMLVQYFPAEIDQTNTALREVADKLYAYLEYLQFDQIRGRGLQMHHRTEEQVLQFYVTVQLVLKRPVNNPKMQQLQTEKWIKREHKE